MLLQLALLLLVVLVKYEQHLHHILEVMQTDMGTIARDKKQMVDYLLTELPMHLEM